MVIMGERWKDCKSGYIAGEGTSPIRNVMYAGRNFGEVYLCLYVCMFVSAYDACMCGIYLLSASLTMSFASMLAPFCRRRVQVPV